MVRMLPVSATIKPAPTDGFNSRIVTVKPFGLPIKAGSSDSEYCVFAIQTGKWAQPFFSIAASCFLAFDVRLTPSAP